MDQDELNSIAEDLRYLRDQMLKETDVWGLADYPATPEQLLYRQALREITTKENWPLVTDVDWPVKPE
jgi:hypothetical protein